MSFSRRRSYDCLALAPWVDTLIKFKISSSNLLLTTIGLTAIAFFGFSNLGLTQSLAQVSQSSQTKAEGKMLFVNPTTGNRGDGSENAPFKTVTQALQVAEPNSTIVLAPGTYNTTSGETFPLKLKLGISIQGDPKTKGSQIVIQGGGNFMSPTFARQNITILGANQARITGVTITNPNSRGYGLWIESSSPVVSDNTFTGSSHDGISITGKSAPIVSNNYFSQNGANGITIYGTSQPQVRENVFENTGFGINIAQKAAPIVVGNRIIKNRAGIISQANARPILRNNTIAENKEDGLVAIATSQPDLGTKTDPGGNVFQQNGRYDINASAAKQIFPAFGNQLAKDRTNGNIDLAGTTSPETTLAAQPRATPLTLNPRVSTKNQNNKLLVKNPRLNSPATRPTQDIQIDNSREQASAIAALAPIEIPVPPPNSGAAPGKLSLNQINPIVSRPSDRRTSSNNQVPTALSNNSIAIDVPPAPSELVTTSQNGSISQGLPVLEPIPPTLAFNPLPVPSANIPLGNTRKQPKRVEAKTSVNPTAGEPPLPPTKATALGLRYRVIVAANSASQQAKVRSLVPGAFRTFSQGKVYMQVGAYKDKTEADEMMQKLSSKGLKGSIEEM